MSTNINQSSLPDTGDLEKIANQLFLAIPGGNQFPENTQFVPKQEQLFQQGNFSGFEHPQIGLFGVGGLGSGIIPKSISGSGVSFPAITDNNVIDLSHPTSQEFPDDSGGYSRSVAGSGISPSAINQGNEVELTNPQTSFPDPNLQGSRQVPQSVAGSGISPSSKPESSIDNRPSYGYGARDIKTGLTDVDKNGYTNQPIPGFKHVLPYETQNPFDESLQEILKNLNTSSPVSQLPGVLNGNESAFYFLNKVTSEPVKNTPQQFNTSKKASGIIAPPFDVNLIKKDFPILSETVNGKPLIWLDNAATTQKPSQVIERIKYFYEHENSNIHRAAHELAARATDAYEEARTKVQLFLNASSINEIIFVRGATEAINLVAKSWGEQNISPGDEIIVSHLEHHANIVPWQQLAAKKGAKIKVIPVDDDGQILLDEYAKLLSSRTKIVAFTQVSNALGTVTPAKRIIELAHQAGAKVLLDGAQSVSHLRVDVRALDADWFVFSGHKVFGPTGIGVLYGKEDLLNQTQPWQGGGNMIADVTFERTVYHPAPGRFEAGTGNIADAVGLGAAIDYVNKIGIDLINQYEHYLLLYATNLLKQVDGLKLIGTAEDKASVLSFVLKGYTNDEVGKALNKEGIAVRTGHHCAQPILRRFGLESTVRPSLAFYNTCGDIDALVDVLHRLKGGKK